MAVTDDTGTLITQQRYLPFGGQRILSGYSTTGLTDYGYTGQRDLDPGMGGLMDYNARFYSPYLNHFTQPDSIVPDPQNPQAWNRYSYALNNPIRYNDPTGHYANPCAGAASGYKCHRGLDKARRQGQIEDELAATIEIGFGVLNDDGSWSASNGLGTVVVNRRTIVTAYHVFEEATDPSQMLYWQGNDVHAIDLSNISIYHRGDLAVITLSEDLPESFVPANISSHNPVSWSSQDIDVAYINGRPDETDPEVLNTNVLFMFPIRTHDLYIIGHNPDYTLNGGDSGGGVFYNGELIGVTSAVLTVDKGMPIFEIRPVAYTWYDLLFR